VLAREDPVLGSEVFVEVAAEEASCCCDEFAERTADDDRECPRGAEAFDDEPPDSKDCTIADFDRWCLVFGTL
jgi:hypothetical protein